MLAWREPEGVNCSVRAYSWKKRFSFLENKNFPSQYVGIFHLNFLTVLWLHSSLNFRTSNCWLTAPFKQTLLINGSYIIFCPRGRRGTGHDTVLLCNKGLRRGGSRGIGLKDGRNMRYVIFEQPRTAQTSQWER